MKKLISYIIVFSSLLLSSQSFSVENKDFFTDFADQLDAAEVKQQNTNQTSDEKVNQNNKKDFFTDFADQLDAAEAKQQK